MIKSLSWYFGEKPEKHTHRPAAYMTPERKICTAEQPWKPEWTKGTIHPDAKVLFVEEGSLAQGGDYERCGCPNCGLKFWVQLPD